MSVYGNGFIATNLKKAKLPKIFDIYAAGISDSNLIKKKEYHREIKTIRKYLSVRNNNKTLIYISSTSVMYKNIRTDYYIRNKLIIEKLVKKLAKNYLIIRLPQVIGKSKNKKTLANFIYYRLAKNKIIYVWKGSKRNLIDIDDINYILKKYLRSNLTKNKVINIFNPSSISMLDLVKIFSKVLRKKPKIITIEKKNKNINFLKLKKNTKLPSKYYKRIIANNYIEKTIRKYYR